MLDKNGVGQVSLAELAAPLFSPSMMALFKSFDKNGNGYIEPDEARNP
jgi:Ca2+-binding EF-hand superfamily protein